jgi:hypothetical protein
VAPIDKTAKAGPEDAVGKPPERAPQMVRTLAPAVTKTKSTRRLRPGDLVCGQCGEGNPPVRKFCSRCGNSLLEAEHVRASWWQRLLHRFRHGPRVVDVPDGDGSANGQGRLSAAHAAGVRKALGGHDPRHTLRKTYRRTRLALGLVIMVGLVSYGVSTPFRAMINGKFDSVKNKITGAVDIHFTPVHAPTATANLQERGFPGSNAVDSFVNTYWLAPYSARDYPTLTLTFAHPVTLERMIIYSGASGNYLADARPSLFVLLYSNNKSMTLTPQDTPQQQTLDISNAVQVTSLKIEVQGIYPGTGSGRSKVAISDIELFKLG